MKKLYLLGLLGLFACQNNTSDSEGASSYPQSEITEVEVNNKVVYAILVRDSVAKADQHAYRVSLKLNDRVWYDTLILDLPAKQMVQGEAIFTEAEVNDMGGSEFEIELLDLD